MGAVIFFCRALPFLLFFHEGSDRKKSHAMGVFIDFAEKIVPPAAMTVLAFNALGVAFMGNMSGGYASGGYISDGFFVLAASVFTAALHLWKKNFLISILGGTAFYMLLQKIITAAF